MQITLLNFHTSLKIKMCASVIVVTIAQRALRILQRRPMTTHCGNVRSDFIKMNLVWIFL